MGYILAIDQGTTSSRAILYTADQRVVAKAQREITQSFPASGWVEHDPLEIWQSVLATVEEAISQAGITPDEIAAIGITNQRETTVLWDRRTGEPLHPAIVWQDRRTAALCEKLRAEGREPLIREKTGLLLDPYFSATKLSWLLENVQGARAQAEEGSLAFGTIDSWLIWKLTVGKVHATDATNAARTMFFNIRTLSWDAELCDIFNIPMKILPNVLESSDDFGTCTLFGADIPILGVAGDQQAAAIGQACFEAGSLKATYGTGCFALLNTGEDLVLSEQRLISTIAYMLDGKPTYALEGSIFVAGAVVQWLRDGLGVIQTAAETYELAKAADPTQEVIMVPAFTGLGAPWWEAGSRGAVFGLTRNSGPAEFARAALQSVGYQTRDLWEAMCADWQSDCQPLMRVDGGMAANNLAMQFLSDILNVKVNRPRETETTALGAAWLAARKAGLWPREKEFAKQWEVERCFSPDMPEEDRARKYARWKTAVAATISLG